jgi:hypothetical protein
MKQNLTKIAILLLVVCSNTALQAYDFSTATRKKKKARKETNQLIGIGWGAFLSGGMNGYYTSYDKDTNDVNEANINFLGGFDILFLGVQYHYTLKKIDKDKSFTIHAFPTLGLNVQLDNEIALGGLQFPLFVNYNYGAGATNSSKEDYGYSLGLGLEFIRTGLINIEKENTYNSSIAKRKNVIQPVFNAGYRYVNDNDKIREWNLKIGYFPKNIADKFGNVFPGETNLPSLWGRLSLTYYLD